VVVTHEGIQLGVLSVVLSDRSVRLEIAGVPIDAATEQRERETWESYAAAFQECSQAGTEPPFRGTHPLGDVHDVLSVSLTDDHGTRYKRIGGGQSGAGWMFFGDRRFEPEVPDQATELIVSFSINNGPSATIRIALLAPSGAARP
jgi:hypothetical protein